MYQIDFNHPIHVHFIGIGGISMSGLAEILLTKNFRVSGSDSQKSALTDALERKGARIFLGKKQKTLPRISTLSYTPAPSIRITLNISP